MNASDIASAMLASRARGSNPGDALGFIREDKQRDALLAHYARHTITRPDGARQIMLVCPGCSRLLAFERDAQRCHVVPTEAIRAAAVTIGRAMDLPEATVVKVTGRTGDARRYFPPEDWGTWVPGCYGCNDSHERPA